MTNGCAKKIEALLKRNLAHVEFVNILGVHRYNEGAAASARLLFDTVLRHDPDNRDARNNLDVLDSGKSAA